MRAAYTLLLRLALPLILLRLWWRGRREPGYREFVAERLGRYESDPVERLLWVHAVSVGEVRAAAPLVRALQAALPQHTVLMTCTTAAGRATIKQVYGESLECAYLPYDYPEAVQAFLEHFRPRLGVLMETEIWPNLIRACATNGVPLVLANARMSEKSARGYARCAALFAPAFGALAAVCAQSEDDARRLRALGARAVEVAGNLKFDVALDAAQLELGKHWRGRVARPVLLLASTREGEEELLLNEINRSKALDEANTLIVVVPRHPQRFDEVAGRADARRTSQEYPDERCRIYLGDTMGEMAFYYAACDVAVVGGSFVPLGGQNLIEALAAGAPVIAGPSMFNFAEPTRLALEAGAALQAADAREALSVAVSLLEDPERRKRMSQAGASLCVRHRGATEQHLAACLSLVKKSPPEKIGT